MRVLTQPVDPFLTELLAGGFVLSIGGGNQRWGLAGGSYVTGVCLRGLFCAWLLPPPDLCPQLL